MVPLRKKYKIKYGTPKPSINLYFLMVPLRKKYCINRESAEVWGVWDCLSLRVAQEFRKEGWGLRGVGV